MNLILPRNLYKMRYIGHKIIKILKILSDGKEERTYSSESRSKYITEMSDLCLRWDILIYVLD